jgi:dUTP diphosphatase
MEKLAVKFVKNHPDAKNPERGSEHSAGWDLTAVVVNDDRHKPYIEYDLGISMEIPPGYVGLLFPRSSVTKLGMSLGNCVGIIDADYRGPFKARFYRGIHSRSSEYQPGERVCQFIIMPFPEIEYQLVDELSDTVRGQGGFGSTDAKKGKQK